MLLSYLVIQAAVDAQDLQLVIAYLVQLLDILLLMVLANVILILVIINNLEEVAVMGAPQGQDGSEII